MLVRALEELRRVGRTPVPQSLNSLRGRHPPFKRPSLAGGEASLDRATQDVTRLKRFPPKADIEAVDAAERREILNRYRDHSRRFEAAAARRSAKTTGSVIPFTPPPALRELEQEPTAREIEVLQLVADGLVNREIGQHLFLSEETVKSHVRHLLAKLQARSRAHAVAVGFRRGLIA